MLALLDLLPMLAVFGFDDAAYLYAALAAASVAASAGGSYLQYDANKKSQAAINNANAAEADRQQQFQKKSMNEFADALGATQPNTLQQREQAAAEQYNQLYQNQASNVFNAIQPDAIGQSINTPKAIGDVYKDAFARGRNNVAAQLAAKAKLSGAGQAFADTGRTLSDAANSQSVLGGFMRGSANVLGTELNNARHLGDSQAGWVQAVSSLGQLFGEVGSAGLAKNGVTVRGNPSGTNYAGRPATDYGNTTTYVHPTY